ncbi:hypothetical protein GPZ77_16690 [Streptomyces sp. QHH-9511]|uniref:hypothetical protein n=1 Tax=Streptomyces sp. QHH-9511 TaxID=2684468 RepID=UPI0013199DB1|nr:hypothetical protein [Streptomyces sp. QHH-9511]QGZ49789.1 hypothetical protein GPZ77_16690 [Streptomyces sp. QHH-9511]
MTHERSPSTAQWRERLASCGLTVLPESEHPALPDVRQSIYAVTGMEVEPTIRIDRSAPEADLELGRQWQDQARQANLYTDDGEFFVLPPGSGGLEIGWVRVRNRAGNDLLSRVKRTIGQFELITASADGRNLCAVTSEEYEYWIIVRSLS